MCCLLCILYHVLESSEFCKITPENAGNGISGTLDLKIVPGGHAPDSPRCFSHLYCSVCPPSFRTLAPPKKILDNFLSF